VVSGAETFDSPEAAALANWPAAAEPRVVSVTFAGDRAEVVIEVDPEYRYRDWVYCIRRDGRWVETVSGNGPTIGWDDPTAIQWGGS
jgi:hypothetical protein